MRGRGVVRHRQCVVLCTGVGSELRWGQVGEAKANEEEGLLERGGCMGGG